jgi:peptidyl-prolyl cis-trans isomerase D
MLLEAIRKRSASLLVKLLFGLLILSFAAWGIGDMIRTVSGESVVAKVGGVKISPAEFQEEYRREISRLRSLFGGEIDAEQAKSLGLVDSVVERMVRRVLFDLGAADAGIRIADGVVVDEIQASPAFRGDNGKFDRLAYEQVLRNNNLSEARFVQMLRGDLARNQLLAALGAGATVPRALVEPLYRHRQERRVVEVATVTADSQAAKVPAPTDDDLAAYHQANPSRFTAPEYRALTAVLLKAEDLAAEIQVPEEKLRETYEQRRGEFGAPERRTVQQMVFADEATAKQGYERLAKGEGFVAVAKDVAKMAEGDVALGTLVREELPPDLAGPTFDLAQGAFTAPLQSPLGWHILRVTAIEAGRQKSFDEVRADLRAEIARDMAIDALYKLGNRLEDELGGGATLDEAAARLNVKPLKVTAVDSRGLDPDGRPVAGLPNDKFLRVAFGLASGADSALTDLGPEGYFVVRVDSITPASLKPLEKVRNEVAAAWTAERRAAAARAVAESVVEKAKSGDLNAAASTTGLTVTATDPFLRGGREANVPQPVASAAFSLKAPGDVSLATGPDGAYAVRLKEIRAADPAADAGAVARLQAELGQALANDLWVQYAGALRARHGVTVYRRTIDPLL